MLSFFKVTKTNWSEVIFYWSKPSLSCVGLREVQKLYNSQLSFKQKRKKIKMRKKRMLRTKEN